MKNNTVLLGLLMFFVVYLLIGCGVLGKSNPVEVRIDTVTVERIDTVFVTDRSEQDSLVKKITEIRDSLVFYRDSIKYEDYINSRRIEKIKYYIKICEKKPTNKKFFFGWIKRTMSED